jgi:branched-chain amino acid aminotransferase
MRVWFNGSVLDDPRAPVIGVDDHGLTVGDGVFETLKVVDGQPFAMTRHLDRLVASATGLGLPAPDLDEVRRAAKAVLDGPPLALARLRITYTAGPAPMGSGRGGGPATLVVAADAMAPGESTTAVARVPWPRNERSAVAGLKTTSYAENVVALAYAKERGGIEAIFANTRGELCEGTGTNVFVVVDGELLTPPLESGCLAGVTRELTLEWCRAEGLPVREQTLPLSVLQTADEVFITSSTKDVLPVSGVDDRDLPAPGPVTRRAAEIFARLSAERIDP